VCLVGLSPYLSAQSRPTFSERRFSGTLPPRDRVNAPPSPPTLPAQFARWLRLAFLCGLIAAPTVWATPAHIAAGRQLLAAAAADQAASIAPNQRAAFSKELQRTASDPLLAWRAHLVSQNLPAAEKIDPALADMPQPPSAIGTVRRHDAAATAPAPVDEAEHDRFALALGLVMAGPAVGRAEREQIASELARSWLWLLHLPGPIGPLPAFTADARADLALAGALIAAAPPEAPAKPVEIDDEPAIALSPAELARTYLERVRRPFGLVIDDAGPRTGPLGATFTSTLLAVNPANRPLIARAGPVAGPTIGPNAGSLAPGELVRIEPSHAALLSIPVKPTDTQLDATIGTERITYTIAPNIIVRAPGLRVTDLPWSLTTADLVARTIRIGPARTTVHLWFDREADSWRLSAAKIPAAAELNAPQLSTLTLYGLDAAQPETPRRITIDQSAAVTSRALLDIPLPELSQKPEQPRRFAMVLQYSDGSMQSWPRAMLPGQTDPGRIAADFGDWNGSR